jgi:hypothetical protein
MHPVEPVVPGVLTNPPGRLPDRRLGYGPGLNPPALIGVLIDITVVTGKIAPAVDLQDILTYGSRHVVVLYGGIEHHRRYARRAFRVMHDPRYHAVDRIRTISRPRREHRQRDVPYIRDQAVTWSFAG